MARTPTQKKERTDACAEYAGLGFDTTCEVVSLLRKCPEASAWIERHIRSGAEWSFRREIHHIFGKDSWREPYCNWFCSLVGIWKVCHDYDAVHPADLEICCIAAKLARHQRWIDSETIVFGRDINEIPKDKWHFRPEEMAKAAGCDTLAGRIEGMLMPKLSEPLRNLAVEVLKELEKST